MDWFDRSIVEYVLAWGPHDAIDDEDTFPAFGMSADQLEQRFVRIIAGHAASRRRLDHADRELLGRARAYQLQARLGGIVAGAGPVSISVLAPRAASSCRPNRTDRKRRLESTASPRARQMAAIAARAATAYRGGDVVIIDVSARLSIAECFVVVSGEDGRQLDTIVAGVEKTMGLAGYPSEQRAVAREGRWVLLDFLDIVVHVQHRSERESVAMEWLWRQSPTLPVDRRETLR
ncbi:ribosome silencing factor [Mycolicibacterium palauense]|uniref:ribosome silencing factor n=1 Tax=Mycolicibacterium palauense TaxID=2034511 RepID=UPI002E1A78B1